MDRAFKQAPEDGRSSPYPIRYREQDSRLERFYLPGLPIPFAMIADAFTTAKVKSTFMLTGFLMRRFLCRTNKALLSVLRIGGLVMGAFGYAVSSYTGSSGSAVLIPFFYPLTGKANDAIKWWFSFYRYNNSFCLMSVSSVLLNEVSDASLEPINHKQEVVNISGSCSMGISFICCRSSKNI